MPYDKDSIDSAKKQGIFNEKVFDAKALELEENEKKRISKDLLNSQKEAQSNAQPEIAARKKKKKRAIYIDVELNLFERIISAILSFFGIQTREQFKLSKISKNLQKDVGKIKPSIYNASTRRVTRYFAYKIHDLYLMTVWMKKIFKDTFDNSELWDNPKAKKTIIESLFERLVNINIEEMDSDFSISAIELVVNQFENSNKAVETIEKSLYSYVYSIDKDMLNKANSIYTNFLYFKKIADYDYASFFKRFDSAYQAGTVPSFHDISGGAIVTYLKDIEENLLQVDLSMDNAKYFTILFELAKYYKNNTERTTDDEKDNELDEQKSITKEKFKGEMVLFFEKLKEILNNKNFTLLIQIIRGDPLYYPSFIHTKFDFFKIYVETLEKRIKIATKEVVKENRIKVIDSKIRKLFSKLEWVGTYTLIFSDELEKNNYTPFFFCYNIALINSFLKTHYDAIVKNSINILVINGLFTGKNFHKLVSDTFYSMDKFVEQFNIFFNDVSMDGNSGKRLMTLLSKQSSNYLDKKKSIDKQIVSINGRARDLSETFLKLFKSIFDIIGKVYKDIDLKPPKYIRNIRNIGGFRNTRFLQSVEKSQNILNTMDEIHKLLKE